MHQHRDVTTRPGGEPPAEVLVRQWRSTHTSCFRRVTKELEGIFVQFQRLTRELDQDEEPQEARTQLGALKRAVSERLPVMFRQIRPALMELEFWRPGILSACDEMWLDQPLLVQGPATWLGYCGRLRQLVLKAMGTDRAAVPVRRGRKAIRQDQTNAPLHAAVVAPGRRRMVAEGTPGSSRPEFLTPQEVAARYHVDAKTVRRKLRNHPEVRHVSTVSKKGHAPNRVRLRIPATLADQLFKIGSRGDL